MRKERLQTDFNIFKSFTLIFLALAILFFIDGCMPYYIPTPEHGHKGDKEVTKDKVKQLEPGTTTKNDVRLLLGTPEEIGGNLYCYYWIRTDGYYGYIFWGGGSEDHSTEVLHMFCLEFMPDDKLKRFKHFESGWGKKNVYQQIEDWENEED
jgi:outer membrane protein assembly factor BamE (lipoprotein component of BamABCDE complex)